MVYGRGGKAVSMTPHGCAITTMVRVRIVRAKIGHPSAHAWQACHAVQRLERQRVSVQRAGGMFHQ